ncbi:hypothetical protein ABZS94_35270 [Streptomyces sp. NPDC005500]|uniref:hypothetical protein n=1 Tax=Streptomyces sp. NPDC005500 TaxID=3155007 RepID=UPI0033A967E9
MSVDALPGRNGQGTKQSAHVRKRILFAPVPLSPTKPLTPSHIKGLLWADVLGRSTNVLCDVDYLYSHSTANLSGQTLGFWSFLDDQYADTDFTKLDEEQIGALYVEFHQQGQFQASPRIFAYRDSVERESWVHPASTRILQLWRERMADFGIRDPGLAGPSRPLADLDVTVEALAARGLCIDHRSWRGPVYVDATSFGLPLRQIVGSSGHANYLACALRELVPLIGDYDEFVLACDREALPDYELLRRVLVSLGASVSLITVGRVRVGTTVQASRHGGWAGVTAAPLSRQFLENVEPQVFKLGLRLYFIATLGPGDLEPFRMDILSRCMTRAERVLSQAREPTSTGLPEFLGRHARSLPYVHPYRLTSALMDRRLNISRDLLTEVFV